MPDFYDGQQDYIDKLNAMADAFHAGPFDSVPKTGGTMSGPLHLDIPLEVASGGTGVNNIAAFKDRLNIFEISNLDFITDPAERAAILAGTSTVDHTAAILAMLNAAGGKYRATQYGVMNSKLIVCPFAGADWYWKAGARIKLIPDNYPVGSFHISLTGDNARLENAQGDGNMSAMISTQACRGLLITGASPKIIRSAFRKYNGNGLGLFSQNTPGFAQAVFDGCNFDDNAGLGFESNVASYVLFTGGTTFDRNGYGFHGATAGGWDDPADMTTGLKDGFGGVLRMRSHHVHFAPGCTARNNARDGICINQGSYDITGQIFAHGNGDGGVTVAADQTFSGLPGEAESPYNLDLYVIADNNYTSGFAAYQPVQGLKLRGKLSNNGRVAGDLAYQASYSNGAYIAGGSTGLDVDVEAYDDRQFRVITATSSGVLTATGWVSGLKNYFPNVAIISGVNQSFKGYGKITAESAGSVTITPTAFNGVTLASIAVGDYVTQAVQHGGVSMGNGCQGQVAATGGGYHFGPDLAVTGYKIMSGGYNNGQNIILPKERRALTQLLVNPSWDADVTTGWTYSVPGGGAAVYDSSSSARTSSGALRLTAGSSNAYGVGTLVAGALQGMLGEFIEYSVDVTAAGRGDAVIQVFWFVGSSTFSTTQSHPGGGRRTLKIGAQIPANAFSVELRVVTAAGKTVTFDCGAAFVIVRGMDPREYSVPSRFLPL